MLSFMKLSSLGICPIASFVHPNCPTVSSISSRRGMTYFGLDEEKVLLTGEKRESDNHRTTYRARSQYKACPMFNELVWTAAKFTDNNLSAISSTVR
jgi:hypothetical protein